MSEIDSDERPTPPEKERRPGGNRWLPGATPWLSLSVLLFALDQWTKHWASSSLNYGRPEVVNEYLDFTLLHNTGAAFSLLAHAGGWQRYFFITLSAVVSLLLIVWIARLPRSGRILLVIGLALIVSGALGNLYDRVMLGYVVDFLHFHYNEHYWPAFNIADTAISAGVVFILLDSFFYREDEAQADAGQEEASNKAIEADAADDSQGEKGA